MLLNITKIRTQVLLLQFSVRHPPQTLTYLNMRNATYYTPKPKPEPVSCFPTPLNLCSRITRLGLDAIATTRKPSSLQYPYHSSSNTAYADQSCADCTTYNADSNYAPPSIYCALYYYSIVQSTRIPLAQARKRSPELKRNMPSLIPFQSLSAKYPCIEAASWGGIRLA